MNTLYIYLMQLQKTYQNYKVNANRTSTPVTFRLASLMSILKDILLKPTVSHTVLEQSVLYHVCSLCEPYKFLFGMTHCDTI